ncbi:MAG: OsmC family protein [Cellvibrionaceae bacterium]
MKSEELSALQAPLKQKYQQDPEEALITLRAEGNLGEGIACKVDTGRALIEAGLHPATGGDGSQACSGDMLLEALAACAGVTLRAVATAFGVDLRNGKIVAEGDLDFRGTLGVSKDIPVGFKEIRLKFETESDADEATMKKLISVAERYCVVLQTIRAAPPVVVSLNERAEQGHAGDARNSGA